MTIYFIDPQAGTNGNGLTANTPMNTLPADYGIGAESNQYLLKAGSIFTGQRSYNCIGAEDTEQGRVTFGAYGEGPKPKWIGTASHCLYLASSARLTTVRDIEFYSPGVRCVSAQATIADTTSTKFRLISCDFSMSNENTGSDRNAVMLYGSDNKLLGNTFDGIPTDAMWLAGNNYEVAYNRVVNVATDGRLAGDCLQFGSDATGSIAHHNFLDHRSTSGKHCIVANIGNNIIFEDNICLHQVGSSMLDHGIYFDGASVIVRRNFISGAKNGLWMGPSADGSLIESNIILQDTPFLGSEGHGIYLTTPVSAILQNNTVISPNGTGGFGIRTGNGGAATLVQIRNNIIGGWSAGGVNINEAVTTKFLESTNIYYNNAADTNRSATAVKMIKINPRLDSNYVPQEYLAVKQGMVGTTTDVYGASFVNAIGAVQPDAASYARSILPVYSTINGHL